jgi:phosphopantothenoylcysteine decarboxylase / phosphopantothenate---cysteine ligase
MTTSIPIIPEPKKAKILLGVTGGIAAYKSCILLRLLIQAGHDVRVVLTKNAERFVAPLTFSTLSGQPVYADPFSSGQVQTTEHIDLSQWADVALVAPATANIIGKLSGGIADDFLSTLLCAFDKPILLAPAMNVRMWENPAVQRNVKQLTLDGRMIIQPGTGYLACGEVGDGRMAEPATIAAFLHRQMSASSELKGKRLLISAGPTCEDVDDIRFLTNRSSGKMGYALARAALAMGAEVELISGPTQLEPPLGACFKPVRTAAQMAKEIHAAHAACDALVMCAAVADYAPVKQTGKMKKKEGDLDLRLVRTQDILKSLMEAKGKRFHVGFAMETEDELQAGSHKLKAKQLDMICVNNTLEEGAGFGVDTNQITLLEPNAPPVKLPLESKERVAQRILTRLAERMNAKRGGEN